MHELWQALFLRKLYFFANLSKGSLLCLCCWAELPVTLQICQSVVSISLTLPLHCHTKPLPLWVTPTLTSRPGANLKYQRCFMWCLFTNKLWWKSPCDWLSFCTPHWMLTVEMFSLCFIKLCLFFFFCSFLLSLSTKSLSAFWVSSVSCQRTWIELEQH